MITSRREFLARTGTGFGMMALAGLTHAERPHTPRPPHYAPKAQRVVHLFMNGGPSQVDTFDPKPRLKELHGKPLRVVCKAIDLRDINPKANLDLKTLLVRNLKTSQMFDYNLTKWGDLDEYEKGNLAEVQADKTDETKARIKTTLFGLDLVLSKPIDL